MGRKAFLLIMSRWGNWRTNYRIKDFSGLSSYLVNPFAAFLYPVFFIGLVVALFRSDREKRILAASVLVAVRLAADFSASFLSCLELVFLHIVKKIPEPFSEEWVIVADA